MKIVRNTLKAVWDRWEDPGDYPSNMGAGPLPPGPWELQGVDGELVVDLTIDEMSVVFGRGFDDPPLPNGVRSVEWHVDFVCWDAESQMYRWRLSVTDCVANSDYTGPEPPDHEDD